MKTIKSLGRKVKKTIRYLYGQDFFPTLDLKITSQRLGSDYGGWNVLLDKLDKNSVIYSFGVGEDISFDLSLIKHLNAKIYAFDPTPKSIEWVKRQTLPDNFQLLEFGIASFDGEISFNPPINPDHVSHTILDRPDTSKNSIVVPVKRYETIIKELGHTEIDLLKMDIEGAEYEVIDDIIASSIKPKQLLIEFHHRFPGVGVPKTTTSLKKLKDAGYLLFSVSKTEEEFSFIYHDKLA